MEKEFIELINSNRGLIFKVCNLYCNDQESRKDLFQEVVLQLWKSYPGFRKISAHSTWIYKVALNTAITDFRRQSKRPQRTTLTLSELEVPDLVTTDKENETALHRAIEKLNEIEKAIILLYLDDKSYNEMSEIIGISAINVGVRLNRIKNKLSELVKTI